MSCNRNFIVSDPNTGEFVMYRADDGSAVEVGRFVTLEALVNVISSVTQNSQVQGDFYTDDDQIAAAISTGDRRALAQWGADGVPVQTSLPDFWGNDDPRLSVMTDGGRSLIEWGDDGIPVQTVLPDFWEDDTDPAFVIMIDGDRALFEWTTDGVLTSTGSGGITTNAIDLITDDGQSNAEGQAGGAVSVVYNGPLTNMLTLLRGSDNDPWLGLTTTGGNSLELDGGTITGIGLMGPQIAATGSHGTLAGEGTTRRYINRTGRRVITFSNAEGGQSIGNLLDDADPEYFAAQNVTTALTRALAVRPTNADLVWRWSIMHQGESNRSTSTLGERHNQYRQECEQKAQQILGQSERLRMISFQPSSTPSGSSTVGIRAILQEALDDTAGVFFCGGPCYQYPWDTDYLHHSSIGHAMRGEAADAIIRRVEDEGAYLPLHAVSAEVTGANEITVTLSEDAEEATDTHVAAVADLGVNVEGATISGVTVSGNQIVITTSDAAAGATEVGFAEQRHSVPRVESGIPRTNIRAARPLGRYSDTLAPQASGGLIRNWLCHQLISVGA